VDGPEFDAHQVDFDTLIMRNRAYAEHERISLERFENEQAARFEGLV
jgi:ferredoxin--NADP+ reductase